jgi:hypothetical protein
MEEETLPPSDILFDDMQELKFELLEKTITLQWAPKVLTGLYMLITFFLFKVQPPNFFS